MSEKITTHQHILEDGTIITHSHVQELKYDGEKNHGHFSMTESSQLPHENRRKNGMETAGESVSNHDHTYEHNHDYEKNHEYEHNHTYDHEHEHSHMHTHSHNHTHTHQNTKAVLNRLSKAIGHLESIKRMVESGRDCSEVLVQLAAVKAAINNTGKEILKEHIEHCIVDAIREEDTQALEELNKAIDRFMK